MRVTNRKSWQKETLRWLSPLSNYIYG